MKQISEIHSSYVQNQAKLKSFPCTCWTFPLVKPLAFKINLKCYLTKRKKNISLTNKTNLVCLFHQRAQSPRVTHYFLFCSREKVTVSLMVGRSSILGGQIGQTAINGCTRWTKQSGTMSTNKYEPKVQLNKDRSRDILMRQVDWHDLWNIVTQKWIFSSFRTSQRSLINYNITFLRFEAAC